MGVIDPEQAGFAVLIFAFLLALVVYLVARARGYFHLPEISQKNPVTLSETVGIFFLYLSLAYLVTPLLNLGAMRLFHQKEMTTLWLGWAQITALFFILICLLTYCLLIKSSTFTYILWGERGREWRRAGRALGMGALSWFVSYPFVYAMGILTSLISLAIWKHAKVDQVAVKQLEKTMDNLPLFSIMILMVVIFVPFMEELLFRGFLQSLLRKYVGRGWGLLLTALIFASVHFAPSQGTGNFQLISSLFVLSLFLGFIYEREQTLFASFALHATFNAFSVILLILS